MSTSTPTHRPRNLPAWLSFVLILLAIAVALGGGWWLMNRSDSKRTIIVEGPGDQPRTRPQRPQQPPQLVSVNRDGGIHADAGAIEMYVAAPATRPTTRPRYVMLRMEEDDAARALKGAEAELYGLIERLRGNRDSAQALKLTPDQKQALEKVRFNALMPITAEEREKLLSLAEAWKAAAGDAKPKAQDSLLAEMRTLGKKHESAALQTFRAQIEKIAAIITEEQLAAYRKARAERRAATKPGV